MKIEKPTDKEFSDIYERAYKKVREAQGNAYAGWDRSFEQILVDEAYQAGRMSVTIKDI